MVSSKFLQFECISMVYMDDHVHMMCRPGEGRGTQGKEATGRKT